HVVAHARFDYSYLPGEPGGDAVVDRGLRLEVKPQLEPAGIRVPPGLEVQPRVPEEPLRLARARPVADPLQAGRKRRLHQRGQRPEKAGRPYESPFSVRGLTSRRGPRRHLMPYVVAAGVPDSSPPMAVLTLPL